MPCSGVTTEDYYLWSLGLLEDSGAELIRTHLAEGCQECSEGVRAGLEFWALFGAASPEANLPSQQTRAQLLERIGGGRRPARKVLSLRRSRFVYLASIAASVLLLLAAGLQFGRWREKPKLSPFQTNSQLEDLTRQIADLQRKLNVSEKQLDSLKKEVPVTPVSAPLRRFSTPDVNQDLEKQLAEATEQIQQLRTALSGEQAKSSRLAHEFDQQAVAISNLSRERRDAEANLAAANGRLAERDRQIKALDAKIVQLERERDKLNDALSNQKARQQHATRLVSLLASPNVRLIRLTGTEAAPRATGYVLIAEGQRLIFTGTGLPGLQPGRAYQLWLMRGRAPGIVSAGVFRESDGQAALEFADASMLNDVRGLAVTEEPQGGSPLPTGHKLLIGTAKS
jgi:hypothetical protein